VTVNWTSIGDVMELQRREVLVESGSEYTEIGVRSFGKGLFIKEPVRGAELGNKRVFYVEPGDLVVSNVFGWEGAVAVASDMHAGLIGSHRFMTWTPSNDLDVRYARHYLLSDRGMRALQESSPGAAGRNRTLSIANMKAIKVPLLDLPEQRRIATYLDGIADFSTQASGHWRTPRNALTATLVGDAPRHPIGSFASQAADAVPVIPSDTYKTVGLMNRGRGCFARPAFTGADTKYRTLFRVAKDQLIFSKLFAWEGSVTVVPESFDGMLVSSEFPTYDLDLDRASPRYVAHLTKWHGLVDELASATTGMGQRRQRVMPAQFEGVRLPFPDLDAQERIADVLDLVTTIEVKMAHRATVADALLPSARNAAFNKISSP
jgi:hypothetical protein